MSSLFELYPVSSSTLNFEVGTNMTFNSGFNSIECCNIYIVKENQTRQPNANIARERFHKAGE